MRAISGQGGYPWSVERPQGEGRCTNSRDPHRPLFAREFRRRRPRPTSRWRLEEIAVTITERQFWLWRAGRRRTQDSRPPCAAPARQGCSRETDAQAAQETGLRIGCAGDRRAAFTGRQSPKSDYWLAITRACARTIELRIRTSRFDGASASNRRDQPSVSCAFTTCPDCGGRGAIIDTPCPKCAGTGKVVREETLTVRIPVGAEDGTALRIPGHGLPA